MAGIIVLGALALLSPRVHYALAHVTTDDAYVDAYPAVISARVPGAVVAIPVHEGQQVRRGAVVARLDDTDARAQVIAARQALAAEAAALAQAQYDVRLEIRRLQAEAQRADALSAQAGDRARSLELSAKSNGAAVLAARQSIREAQAAYDAAQAQIPAAKTRLANARSRFARMQQFAPQGIIPPNELEAAQNEYAQAQAELQSALAAAAQAKANVAATRAKADADALQSQQAQASASAEQLGQTIAQSDALENSPDALAAKQAAADAHRAQVSAAKQALALAEYRLSETVLRSPVDGYVASRPGTVGEALQPGDPAVVVMPSSGLYVTANFKETQIDRVRDGARADVHVDAFPNVTFYGHVQEFGAAAQSALSIAPNTQVSGNFVKITQRVPIRVLIDRASLSPAPALRPGLSAEVSIAH